MSSNEHPDMSGNPCDQPYICVMCGCEVREDQMYGSRYDEDAIMCSDQCAQDFDESHESKYCE
jgi:hypothetical protein